jgi:hypothetical protein
MSSATSHSRKDGGNDGASSLVMNSLQQLCGAAFSLHYVLLLAAAQPLHSEYCFLLSWCVFKLAEGLNNGG